jgi:hypothetical protein
MKLKVTDIIPVGSVAYHIHGGIINDMMLMGKNDAGYKGQMVQELINGGWSFVCAKKEFKKGDKCKYKPDPEIFSTPELPMKHIPIPQKTPIQYPYCKHDLHIELKTIAQVTLS